MNDARVFATVNYQISRRNMMAMNNPCNGSRQRVLAKRHCLNTSTSGHMKAKCPVCRAIVGVRRVFGVLEFSRHSSKP
jgi:hypothetical protein